MLREAPLAVFPSTTPAAGLPAPSGHVVGPVSWAAPTGPPVGLPNVVDLAAAGDGPVVDRRTGIRMFDSRRRRVNDPVELPHRAEIALLTLQLRASLHEAAAAEAEEAAWDPDVALTQLRARLQPLVEDRRRALDQAIEEARTEADAAVAAARAEVFAATPESSTVADITKQVLVTSDDRDPSSMTVVVDPDSFSRAFAAAFAVAFAAVLDERFAGLVGGAPAGPAWHVAPAPVPARKSFWSGMWHADVFLSLVAMLVVLVVLVAWSV